MSTFFVDFHCHPSMKPYGKSFKQNPTGKNTTNRKSRNSLWHYDSPNLFEKGIQLLSGISKFTQADMCTLAYGDVRLICASLYPIERGFFNNKLGDGKLSDLADSFITGVGMERVDFIQKNTNYFSDVQGEYDFYQQLDGLTVKTDSGNFKYVMVNSYDDIENNLATTTGEQIIFIVLSIEGLHVLNSNIATAPDKNSFLKNLQTIKAWRTAPFFVTFSHHFYNHLCGHAKSLTDIVGGVTDQREGLNEGFTQLGKDVLREVLSRENGKRILIDIKHMSAKGRKEYFKILETEYVGQHIPIIVSHGAANGMRSMEEPVVDGKNTGFKLLAEDINFYDEEIVTLAKSDSIFGFQLDERRIASKQTLHLTKHSLFINKIRHYRAELLWNQIRHIAELLDRHDLYAWNCMALGTDFEGIINPLNGYLTAETLVHLEEYVERYAYDYMNGPGKLLKPYNCITPAEIVNRVFHSNGLAFIKKYFTADR
jgi:microsomal dipeptidase-like Zn-dependent dipeptidase